MNYNTGQTSAFAFAGPEVGWNGAANASAFSGFVWGLDRSNASYSGWSGGLSAAMPLGELYGSVSPSGTLVLGVKATASFTAGKGSAYASLYADPVQLGQHTAFTILDFAIHAVRKSLCN